MPVQPDEVQHPRFDPFHPCPHGPRADAEILRHLLHRLPADHHPPQRAVDPVHPRGPPREALQRQQPLQTPALRNAAGDQRYIDAPSA